MAKKTKFKRVEVRNEQLDVTFNPLLKYWLYLIDSYPKQYSKEDELFWGTERALVSALAGAIWRKEKYAQEAYGEYKKREKEKYIGRADLWFLTKGKDEYNIEAKKEELNISKRARKYKTVLPTRLGEAVDAAGKIKDCWKEEYDSNYIGVVFAIPVLPTADYPKSNILTRLKRFIDIVESVDCDFYAYYLKSEDLVEGYDWWYPGVAILGQVVG